MKSLGGVGLDEWKRTDRLDIFHYGYGRMMPVHYELYADATRYDCADAALAMPIQVFQGRRDDAVDPVAVEQWAQRAPERRAAHARRRSPAHRQRGTNLDGDATVSGSSAVRVRSP